MPRRWRSVVTRLARIAEKAFDSPDSEDPLVDAVAPSEQKILAGLQRACTARNVDVLEYLIQGVSLFESSIASTMYDSMKCDRPGSIVEYLSRLFTMCQRVAPSIRLAVASLLGRVAVSLLICYVNLNDWANAYMILQTVRSYRLNPLTLKPVFFDYSGARIATVCSEVNSFNNHLNAAMNVLITNNLFSAEPSEWEVDGTIDDKKHIQATAVRLLTAMNDLKLAESASKLFLHILAAQKNLLGPINLSSFPEVIFNNMAKDFQKYKDAPVRLYQSITFFNPELTLKGSTYRQLLMAATTFPSFPDSRITTDQILSNCISSDVFPSFRKKESTIVLLASMTKMEMKLYIAHWLDWYISETNYPIHPPPKCYIEVNILVLVMEKLPNGIRTDSSLGAAVEKFVTAVTSYLGKPPVYERVEGKILLSQDTSRELLETALNEQKF